MRASASKASLLDGCAWWARDGVVWTETRGRAAVQGDEFHVAIAPIVDPTIETLAFPPTTKWFRERFAHACEWVEANRVPGMRAEVAYAYDPEADTGRVLGYNIGRAYEKHGKLPHEIAGSADIAWSDNDVVQIRDWKSGRSVTDAVWPQLEWLGLLAVRATPGSRTAIVGPLHATDYGIGDAMQRVLDATALKAIADKIRAQAASIADAWPTSGEHCDGCYCPARPACDLYQLAKKVGDEQDC